MGNLLTDYFSRFANLTEKEEKAIIDSMETCRYKKGDYLQKEGQQNADTFFLLEGLVREYKLHNDEEITTNFYTAGEWILSLRDFADGSEATEYLVCMEDTLTVVGSEEKAEELFRSFPGFEKISRAVMETIFHEKQTMFSRHIVSSPEERYQTLKKTRPELFQRVSQYHLASYIGIKPESLSRIRKRIHVRERQQNRQDAES